MHVVSTLPLEAEKTIITGTIEENPAMKKRCKPVHVATAQHMVKRNIKMGRRLGGKSSP